MYVEELHTDLTSEPRLFSRVVTNRLARTLDEFQPTEQAGFRNSYSTVDHIHAVRQIIQEAEEYN